MQKNLPKNSIWILIGFLGLIFLPILFIKIPGLALLISFGIATLILLMIVGPLFGFLLYFPTTFFVPIKIYFQIPVTVNQLAGIIYLFSFLLWYLRYRPQLEKKSIFKFLCVIVIYFLINTLTGEDFEAGLNHGFYLLLYFFICLTLTMQYRNLKAIKIFLWIILIFTALSALPGLYEAVTGIDILTKSNSYWRGHLRVNGMAANPIIYGSNLIWAFPFGYFLFCYSKTFKGRMLALLLTFFCVVIALLTFNRQVYIYLLGALIAIGIFLKNQYSRRFMMFLIIIGIISSFSIASFIYTRFTSPSQYTRDMSLAFRVDGIKVMWKVLSEKPLFGIGLGSYPTRWQNHLPDNVIILQFQKGYRMYPDLGFNQLLVETGLIGFLLAVSFFTLIVLFLIRNWREALANGWNYRLDYIGIIIGAMTMFLLQNCIQDTFLNIRTWLLYSFILSLENKDLLVK